MASPSTPSSSPFANIRWSNSLHGFRRFGDDGIAQAATQDEASPFGITNKVEHASYAANGSLPCQTAEEVLGGASTSALSFGIVSTNKEHAPGETTQDSSSAPFFSFGKAPSSFSFGKAPLLADNSKEHEPRIPFQQSPTPFSFSSFLSVKPETHNLFQKSIAHVSDGSTPSVTTPRSPFGPAFPKESSFWRPSISKENIESRVEGRIMEPQGFFRTPSIQAIPSSGGQNVGGPVSTSPFSVFNPMPSASGLPNPGTASPFPALGITKPGFDKTCSVQGPLLHSVPAFSPFDFGALQPKETVDSMEEDNVVSFSAMPSYENISPEELRWHDYQSKKTDFTFVCKSCKSPGSLTPTPSTSLEPPSTSYYSHLKEIPENNPSSLALPLFGKQNAVQFAPSMLGLSSAPAIVSSKLSNNDGITTLSSPLQPFLGFDYQAINVDRKPDPITSVQPSLQSASVDQNISTHMPPKQAIPENSIAAPLGAAFNYSNVASRSSVQLGISSLPVIDKSAQTRSISLLASSKQVFQKTVIRMQARRHGSVKDGPRVSFVNDYID